MAATTPSAPQAPFRHIAERHAIRERAVLFAEARRIARELRAIGPLPSDALARRCHAEQWHDGDFEAAVRAGVHEGMLRRLPFDFLAANRDL